MADNPHDPWGVGINELMAKYGEGPLIKASNKLLSDNPDMSDAEFNDAIAGLCEVGPDDQQVAHRD